MKIPNINVVLKKRIATDKHGYLNYSVTSDGKQLFKSAGYKIAVKDWDSKNQKVKNSNPDASIINLILSNEKTRFTKELQLDKIQDKKITRQSVELAFNGKRSTNAAVFFGEFIDSIKLERRSKTNEKGKYSENNIRKWEGVYNRFLAYSKGDVTFSDIDVSWMERYEQYNAKTLDKDTSLPVHMSRVRQVLKRASDRGIFDISQIAGYKLPPYKNPDRAYLTLAQIDTIWDKIEDGSLVDTYRTVAIFFLVECLSGLRFSDWRRFTIEKLIDKERIKVSAKKNGEPVYLPFYNSPRLKRVIDLIRGENIVYGYTEPTTNAALKIIAGICKIPISITSHLGRHTFATLMLEHGYNTNIIADWMGVTENVVKIYAKRIRTAANKEYEEKGGL